MSDPNQSTAERRSTKESKKRKPDHDFEVDVHEAAPAIKKPKKSKRKHEEGVDPAEAVDMATAGETGPITKDADVTVVKPQKSKKRKLDQTSDADPNPEAKQRTKDNKEQKKAKAASAPIQEGVEAPKESAPAEAVSADAAPAETEEEATPAKKTRFIAFVGNLPYTTTTESLAKHFAAIHPDSIRHRTEQADKAKANTSTQMKNKKAAGGGAASTTPKSKGFAFLEFSGYDRMKSCLKSYHHSMFDDGKSPARRINVELTAGGGGGKSKDRKDRIMAKNWKLNEQRKRRAVEEEKQRKSGGKKQGQGDKAAAQEEVDIDTRGDIHPSRLARVKA